MLPVSASTTRIALMGMPSSVADDLREQRLDALTEIADAGEECRGAIFGNLDMRGTDIRPIEAVADAVEHRPNAETTLLHLDHSMPCCVM